MAKVTKESVDYRPAQTETQRCENCVMYHNGVCDLVAGAIQTDHVCDRWEKITVTEQAARTEDRPNYGPGSEHSYIRDLGITSGFFNYGPQMVEEATARLRSMNAPVDRQGETRAGMTSAATSGGSYVTPEYYTEDFALFLSPLSSFAYQCTELPDKGYGLTMDVPSFTAAVGTGQQVGENQSTAGNLGAGLILTGNLVTIAGSQPVSQQLLDRAGPTSLDVILSKQLGDEQRQKIDNYIVAQAIANGQAVAGASTFNVANLFGDITKAADQMADDANGGNLEATHFFAVPKQVEFFTGTTDPNGRPIFLVQPDGAYQPDKQSPSGTPAPGATGYNVLGLAVYKDGNIANASGNANAQLLVARPSEIFVQFSKPYFRIVVEEYAQTLSVNVQAYRYCGIVLRHASAVQVITGNAYPKSPSFA